MRRGGRIAWVGSLGIAALVWTLFTWPLALHFHEGIPASHRRPPHETIRYMVPGDHLQLLYHFWLAGDMLAGQTPLFQNPYEFNEGDDDARREPGSYYAPFSLIYAVLAAAGGRAFGWNLTGFLSVWLTALFTWQLAARYTPHRTVQALATVIGIALPFRWMSLLGGSPTGFAMAWVPLLALGLDDAVRRGRVGGGLWAGLALIFSAAGDAHVFFFSALSAPFWCLFAAVSAPPAPSEQKKWLRRRWRSLGPAVVGGILALALSRGTAAEIGAAQTSGRAMREIALFSPRPVGLLAHSHMGISNQATIGWTLGVLLFIALIRLVVGSARDRGARRTAWGMALLLSIAVATVILLALGPWGPARGLVFRAARRLLPPYRMIRQAGKVYVLMPTLAALTVAAASRGTREVMRRRRRLEWAAAIVFAAAMLAEYRPLMQPHICLLRERQGAYAAVADEARHNGAIPRALALPLWPGDSHYASVYQHYASLYRLRLVNGYRPFVPARYIREVFEPFQSLNQGEAADEQLDALLARGIRHILFHEDLFPEQVSPFPAGATLARLFIHPRLTFVERDGPVFAFRIRPRATEPGPPPPLWARHFRGYFPAWRWSADTAETSPETSREEGATEHWARLATAGAFLQARRPLPAARFPGLQWRVRARGHGVVLCETAPTLPAVRIEVDSNDWAWMTGSCHLPAPFVAIRPRLSWETGAVDISLLLLEGDAPSPPAPGETIRWPASWFFRAGWSVPEEGRVLLEPTVAPNDEIFYGPRLSLPPGNYEATLRFSAETPAGVEIGRLRLDNAPALPPVAVRAGEPVHLRFQAEKACLFEVRFLYLGRARVILESLELTRAPEVTP